MHLITVLAVGITIVAAASTTYAADLARRSNDPAGRIVGGNVAFIWNWPSQASILFGADANNFRQICGGSLVSDTTVLSAAHCVRTSGVNRPVPTLRLRLGSTWANSGGRIYNVAYFIINPEYNMSNLDADIVLLRSALRIGTTDLIRPAGIAGPTYNLLDNAPVTILGWGRQWDNGPFSEQLRYATVQTINQNECQLRYGGSVNVITPNMLCTGLLTGGRDACEGDFGGPVLHLFNEQWAVVGVTSFGRGCATPQYPGVSARVSRFSDWIVANA